MTCQLRSIPGIIITLSNFAIIKYLISIFLHVRCHIFCCNCLTVCTVTPIFWVYLFDCYRLKPDKLDISRCFIVFDLKTGCISSRDVLTKDPQLLPSISAEPIGVGDTLTLEIIGNKIIVVTDPQVNCLLTCMLIFSDLGWTIGRGLIVLTSSLPSFKLAWCYCAVVRKIRQRILGCVFHKT